MKRCCRHSHAYVASRGQACLLCIARVRICRARSWLVCGGTNERTSGWVTMWVGVISAAVILCCTSCITSLSAHSFNADQSWENAVTEEVEKLLRQRKEFSTFPAPGGDQQQMSRPAGSDTELKAPGPDFSFYTPPTRGTFSNPGSGPVQTSSDRRRLRGMHHSTSTDSLDLSTIKSRA